MNTMKHKTLPRMTGIRVMRPNSRHDWFPILSQMIIQFNTIPSLTHWTVRSTENMLRHCVSLPEIPASIWNKELSSGQRQNMNRRIINCNKVNFSRSGTNENTLTASSQELISCGEKAIFGDFKDILNSCRRRQNS